MDWDIGNRAFGPPDPFWAEQDFSSHNDVCAGVHVCVQEFRPALHSCAFVHACAHLLM